jgi:LacI family transcriptional regulator
MTHKKDKRITIYDIAEQIGIAPSSVSKALNDLPTVSKKIKSLVKAKALELNYMHNANAANLRRGSSKIIGVVVPKINTAFFADAISGMEEVCFDNGHHLIICQSDESYIKEEQAVETLIRQNVDCILISLSAETKSSAHLQKIIDHQISLIQFDRVDESVPSPVIVNNNRIAAYQAVCHLLDMKYKKIAFLGGSDHLAIYQDRKDGYYSAIREAELSVPYNYIVDNALTIDKGMQAAMELLQNKNPPDAFFAVSDNAALGVMKAAASLQLKVPEQIGIVGFANESFAALISPSLSSVDQQSKKLGRDAANIYFKSVLKQKDPDKIRKHVIESFVVARASSAKRKMKSKRAS